MKMKGLLLASAIAGLPATSVFAQEGGTPETVAADRVTADIVVTASRREQNLQDVGISVTALGAHALESLGVKQTTDIVAQVPGLKYNAFSPSVTVYNIRGISQNAYNDHLEPPVAMYIDDAYVATTAGAGVPSFDIARVEVLRGPQGTLFGRNATGGLIHFISNRPTKDFEAYVDITGGTRGHFNAEGAISGPLSEKVQARLSGIYNYREAYLENVTGGAGAGNLNNYAFRGQVALQPTEDIDLLFIARYARNKNENVLFSGAPAFPDADGMGRFIGNDENPWGTCNGCDAFGYRDADGNPYTVASDWKGFFNRRIYGFQGRLDWDFGPFTLSSITDYQNSKKDSFNDDDATSIPLYISEYHHRFYQLSQEVRLSGNVDHLRWTAGFYYLKWRSRFFSRNSIEAYYGTPEAPYVVGYRATLPTETWSLFAQAEYDITPQLTFIGGIRYVEDKKSINHNPSDNAGFNLEFNPTTYPDLAREHFKDYALRAQVNYKITPDVLLYASFNRGIKGPSFSTPGFPPIDVTELPHKGETLLAYEAGVKSTMLDGKVRLNVSGFIYDYKDYQGFFFQDLSSRIRNLPAKAKGIEAELTLLPVEGLTLSGGVSLMDSKVKGVGLPSGRFINTDLPQAPGISGNFLARYERPVSESLKVALQFDMTFTDDFNFQLVPAPVSHEPAYAAGNVRLTLADIDDRWNISLFGRNIWKELYRNYAVDLSLSAASVYTEPRWFGAQLRFNLGK